MSCCPPGAWALPPEVVDVDVLEAERVVEAGRLAQVEVEEPLGRTVLELVAVIVVVATELVMLEELVVTVLVGSTVLDEAEVAPEVERRGAPEIATEVVVLVVVPIVTELEVTINVLDEVKVEVKVDVALVVVKVDVNVEEDAVKVLDVVNVNVSVAEDVVEVVPAIFKTALTGLWKAPFFLVVGWICWAQTGRGSSMRTWVSISNPKFAITRSKASSEGKPLSKQHVGSNDVLTELFPGNPKYFAIALLGVSVFSFVSAMSNTLCVALACMTESSAVRNPATEPSSKCSPGCSGCGKWAPMTTTWSGLSKPTAMASNACTTNGRSLTNMHPTCLRSGAVALIYDFADKVLAAKFRRPAAPTPTAGRFFPKLSTGRKCDSRHCASKTKRS
mmetsp:Transcript_129661/g.415891  ORF Transcript_129661/g.415891 Transcript_129661/m.415891 type:complete len:390 (+) Transcript_129661:340-1509(+)